MRQTGPHGHMVAFDPGSGDVLVPDLGIDAVSSIPSQSTVTLSITAAGASS